MSSLVRMGVAGFTVVAIALGGCLPEEDEYPAGNGNTSSGSSGASSGASGTSGTSGTSPDQNGSSGVTSSSGNTSSSSSGGPPPPPPPPPPPQPLPGACFRDGAVLPAGPAPTEIDGDCYHDGCDGVSKDGVRSFDATDVKIDPNPCVAHTCTYAGAQSGHAENGKACGTEGGVCFKGKCTVCKPQNATTCGGEGPSEPSNDSSATPMGYGEYSTVCGYSDTDDTDWYTFYAKDDDWVTDIMRFEVWSTAPSVEVCVYVKCGGGTPGGCPGIKAGPNGSQGCCWTGPGNVKLSWDLDCSNTSEDSGDAYVSVRTPGGDACEPYLISGGY